MFGSKHSSITAYTLHGPVIDAIICAGMTIDRLFAALRLRLRCVMCQLLLDMFFPQLPFILKTQYGGSGKYTGNPGSLCTLEVMGTWTVIFDQHLGLQTTSQEKITWCNPLELDTLHLVYVLLC